MFEWIKRYRIKFIAICVAVLILLVGVPFAINLLFKFSCNVHVFEAEWSAGDALGYYGAILSFVGTVVLGALALYQNHIIKEEADKKAMRLEEQERIENMPKFYLRHLSAQGFCGNLRVSINNISNNIAYDINIYGIKIKNGSETIWEDQDIFCSPAINPQKNIEIHIKSQAITGQTELILFANMNCKDKYNTVHEYLLKMICRYPNNYDETSITEVFENE